jgi:hypothetical protein
VAPSCTHLRHLQLGYFVPVALHCCAHQRAQKLLKELTPDLRRVLGRGPAVVLAVGGAVARESVVTEAPLLGARGWGGGSGAGHQGPQGVFELLALHTLVHQVVGAGVRRDRTTHRGQHGATGGPEAAHDTAVLHLVAARTKRQCMGHGHHYRFQCGTDLLAEAVASVHVVALG